jgi:Rps23 Pro-64 3,4-dihydroxylase Tpa1-like proline 4-hydroxylase
LEEQDNVIQINPNLDRKELSEAYRRQGWVQIRDVLTPGTARAVQDLLVERTQWGLAWQVGPKGLNYVPADQIAAMTREDQSAIVTQLNRARKDDAAYSFAYSSYSLDSAPQDSPHGELLTALNGPNFLDLIRTVTNDNEIIKVDGQATLYAPGHYLAAHDDHYPEQGRRVAYVLSMTKGEWRPEWGGYLNFFSRDGDIEAGIRPRFNSLNLFSVPRWHNVSQVLMDAPIGRYAITGWGRSK